MAVWDFEKTSKFYVLWGQTESLFNVKSPLYHNKNQKKQDIDEIAADLGKVAELNIQNSPELRRLLL